MTVVSSWGCLGLGGERRQCRLITGHEDSPPRPASCPGHQYGRAAPLGGGHELYLTSDRP
ncbi:hypothetical protein D6B98_38975 [Bradyrhizobium sp. LVM 105]|nr:hypothetical protein D6B98_38975 [Bradyrhizobium sp. LVM 105]